MELIPSGDRYKLYRIYRKGDGMKKSGNGVLQAETKSRVRSQVIGFLRELLFTAACVLIVNSFVLAAFEVPTGSMMNTVNIGDRLFVNKFIYGGSTPYTIPLTSIRIPHFRLPGFRSVSHGDVIVFDWPGNRDQVEKPKQAYYLKRCIGLPGDVVRINQRVVTVNGQVLAMPPNGQYLRPGPLPAYYPNPDIFPRESGFNEDNFGPLVVPGKGMSLSLSAANLSSLEVFIRREGHQVLLTDNKILIDGHPATQYVVERNYVFAMGDNRDNSLDSRFWGFVPVDDIIGTPMIVFWSWDPQIPLYHPIEKLLSVNLRRIGTVIR
jgi:signal peptidase I